MQTTFVFFFFEGKTRPTFCPKPKVGTTKYGPTGLFNPSSFESTGLSHGMCEQMANIANYSLAKSTWSSYRTAQKHLISCQKELNIKFHFPMSSDNVLAFVSWLIRRGLSAKSINAYISGIRTIHLTKGIDQPALRPPIVNSIIEGKSHIDTVKARLRVKPKRMPVTLKVLKLLKAKINLWDESDQMRLLVWATCLICFFGGFRIHEILSKTQTVFDPAFTLLG